MLKINSLYKEQKNNAIKDININLGKGSSISIECSNEVSDLLVNMILGKESPSKGEIYLEGIQNLEYLKSNIRNIGFIPREDFFYEKMTIDEYIKFFTSLLGSKQDYKKVLLNLALLDISGMKIKTLNYSQRRRLSFAREILKEPKLLIFQEPILNMDRDGAKIIIENIENLCSNGTSLLITSVLFKDTLMLGEKSYILNDKGLLELNNCKEEASNDLEEAEIKNQIYKVEKIATKVDERILLFDPNVR